MVIDPRQIEVIDDDTAAMFRAKTGAERLAIASGLYSYARRTLLVRVRSEHPEWPQAMVTREVARRLSHGAV